MKSPHNAAYGARRLQLILISLCLFAPGAGIKAQPELSPEALVVNVISQGRNNMPPLGGVFTPEQLRDVAGYVARSIAE